MADISKINGYNIKDATARALIEELQAATGLTLDDLFNAARTSVQIGGTASSNNGVVIGKGASSSKTGATAVGQGARVTANYGTAVGLEASAGSANSVAIGKSAKTATTAYAVQLGYGTNEKACVKYRGYYMPHYTANTLTYTSSKTEEDDTFYHPTGYVKFYGYSTATQSEINLQIAWGAVKLTGSSSSSTTVSMGASFTSANTYSVFVTGQGTDNYNYGFGVEPYTAASFKIKYGSSSAVACRWVAIGY